MRSLNEVRDLEYASRASDFVTLAKLSMLSNGSWGNSELLARQYRASDRAQRLIKAAVGAGGLADAAGSPDLSVVSAGFLDSLSHEGVFDAMASRAVFLPMSSPGLRVLSAITAGEVAEGGATPVSAYGVEVGQMAKTKVAAIVVLSRELVAMQSAGASRQLATELRRAAIAATDGVFLTGMAVGVTPTTSGGATAALIHADCLAALAAVGGGAGSAMFWVMGPARARGLATKTDTAGATAFPTMTPQGGSLLGLPVLVSDAVAADEVMLVDAASVAMDPGSALIETAGHADLKMADDPDGTPGAMVSLWQGNLVATRVLRSFAFEKLRDDAVHVLDSVAW